MTIATFATAVLMAAASAAAPSGAATVAERRFLLDRAPRLALAGSVELAADDYGRVYRSASSGADWEPSYAGLPVPLVRHTGPVLLAREPEPGNRVYALLRVPFDATRATAWLYRSVDDGRSWTAIKELPRDLDARELRVRRDGNPVVEIGGPGRQLELRDLAPFRAYQPALPAAEAHAAPRLPRPGHTSLADTDAGDVAVLEDDGTFVSVRDLGNRSLRLTPSGATAWSASFVAPTAIAPIGTDLLLGDDARSTQTLPFAFPFFGASHTTVVVSANGGITLGADDPNPDFLERPSQLQAGPPRIAPFWDDLDPGTGGQVLFDAQPGRVTITWYQVPQVFSLPPDQNSFQLVLEPSGAITLQWGAIAAWDGLAGWAPGGGATINASDLSLDAPFASVAGEGTFEWFSDQLWIERAARRFLHCHADQYDQILLWGASDYPYLVSGELALGYADPVRNDVQGLGLGLFDRSPQYGSAGVLRNVIVGGNLILYPDDPSQDFQWDANALDLVGQHTGRQWGAYVRFDDAGTPSTALLGRDLAHWSFFLDSDASVLEGNRYQDNLDGTFTTIECDERYSTLDRYLMGLVPPGSVPDSVLLEAVTSPGICSDFLGSPYPCVAASPPETLVTVTATPRTVTIGQITSVVANGPRVPPAAGAPTPLRQAWVLLVPPGGTASPIDIAKIDLFRSAFGPYFQAATGGLGSIDSTLVATSTVPVGSVGNRLRAIRSYLDVILDWRPGPLAPRRYVVHGTGVKMNLRDDASAGPPPGIGTQPRLLEADSERVADRDAVATRSSPWFYEVFGRDCADLTVFP